MSTTPPSPARHFPVIRVFVSSTFSDLVAERNALAEKVWPELERYCRQRGFTFQAIDLRWGVPSEAGLDHRTMQICFEELHRAQEASPEPNFLILLGDKYGWRPLPETISESEYARLFEHTQSPEEQRTLKEWYRRDANAIPPHHILRARTDSPDGQDYTRVADADGRLRDTDAWLAVQETLWAIVNRAYPASLLRERFAEGTDVVPASVRFQGSATEQEIWNGALKVENARDHVVAWFRKIDRTRGDPEPSMLKRFFDLKPDQSLDLDAGDALDELKTQVERKLAPEPFLHAECRWATDPSGTFTGEVATDHLAPMCETILTRLRALILRQINDYWQADLSADDATATAAQASAHALDLELRNHRRFAQERGPVDRFVGRDEQVRTLRDYLQATTNRPLIVHGPSGSGKTALLAYVAQQPFHPGAEAGDVSPLILTRFIGAHPESSTLRGLMTSLCRELRVHFPVTTTEKSPDGHERTIPAMLQDTLQKLIEEFYAQLSHATAEQPIFVILDALDQLEAADQARECFWLRSQILPHAGESPCHARIVASCLSPSPDFPTESDACEPFRRLQSRELLAEEELGALGESAAIELLRCWLADQQRCLTKEQWQSVDTAVSASSSCRHPLYLQVLHERLRGWREFDEPTPLPATLPLLIQETLERLCQPNQHGLLPRTALGYLVSARYGLSEGELLEVLFRDPEMQAQLEAAGKAYGHRLPPESNRYPIAPWARLRSDLRAYLSERAAPGTTVLFCYHRQIEQAVHTLFLATETTRAERRRLLADYFDTRWDQPDAHALMEFPDLLLVLPDHERLYNRLTDFAFPMRKAEVGLLESVAGDYTRLAKERPASLGDSLQIWQDFFRESAHILRRGVADQSVHKILLQLALEHADDSPVTIAAEKWLAADSCNWLRLQRFQRPPHVLRNPCVATFEGHTKGVKGAVMLKNGRLLSWSDDGTIRLWNVETASCEVTLWDHDSAVKTPDDLQTERAFDLVIRGGVKEVVYIPSGLLVSWSKYQHFLAVWDAERGILLTTLQGHTGEINDALVMEDGRLVSWSEDNFGWDHNLCLWDIASGACGQVIDADQFFYNGPPSVDDPLWGIAESNWSINRFKGAIKLDATHLVVCSTNGTAKLWDAANAACVGTLAPQLDEEIKGVLDLADGRFLSWSDGNDVRVWERDSCLCLMTLEGHTKAVNGALKLSDGCLLTWSDDFTLRLWRGHDGASLAELKGHASDIRCVLQLSKGNLLSCSDDFTLRLWNGQSSACMAIFEGHTQGVLGAIELDDARVLSWSNDYTLRIWDMAWGECLAVLRGHTDEVRGVLKFEDGRLLSWSNDGTLRVWDLAGKRSLAATEGHEGVIRGAKVLEDGRIVSWSSDETIRMWDCRSGECISTLEGQLIGASDVGELGGGRIVSWSGSTLYVWNIETGMCLATHDGHAASVYGARVFGNRKALSWSSDGMLRVWNIMNGNCLATMVGHNKAVSGTLDLPGRRLLTWSQESDLIIWDSQTGECLTKLEGHTKQVLGALVLKTGRLVSWGDDQMLRVWDAETGACLMTYKRLIEARSRLNGDVVAWGYQDILLLDGDTGFCKLTLSGHTGWVGGVVELASQQLASWSNNGIQRRLLDVESFDGMNSPSTQTPQASPEIAFRLWDGSSGTCLEVLSKAEASERHPDWLHAQVLSVKPAWTSQDYFITFSSRTAELRHKAITGIIAAWQAESEVYASRLLPDGTAVFLQANFQISILHLHHGKHLVSLEEARPLVASPVKNAASETYPRRYIEIQDCIIAWDFNRFAKTLKVQYKPERANEEAVNLPKRPRSAAEIKGEAAAWERRHLWEAAATHYDNLLKAGEPLAALGVPLVRCLVQTHSVLLPGTITRVQSIISDLENQGLSELALEARRHLEAKLPSPRKPWWKVW